MLKFNFINLLLILILTGCFAGRKDDGVRPTPEDFFNQSRTERGVSTPFDWDGMYDSEKTDFTIASLEADLLKDSDAIEEETGQVQYVDYVFKAKLRHLGNRQELIGHKFRITGFKGEEVFEEEVQNNGFLIWTETIEFDALRPQFDPVLVVKKIEGIGAVRGVTHAVYELNPWAAYDSDLGDHFRDLSYSRQELKKRHSDFDPSDNYVMYLQNPGTRAPEINVGRAGFYLRRAEPVVSTVSHESNRLFTAKDGQEVIRNQVLRMYSPVHSPPTDARNFVLRRGKKDDERGSLADLSFSRNFVLRDSVLRENVSKGFKEPPPLGVRLRLGANIRLETEISNGDKTVSFTPINKGVFRIHAALIGSNQGLYDELGNEERILLAVNSSPIIASVEDQMLNVEFDMIANQLTNRGDLDLAIKVVPLKKWEDAGLKSFSGVFKVGDYTSLAGFSSDFRDVITASNDFNFDDLINRVTNFTEQQRNWFLENGITFEPDDMIFDSMKIRFRTVKAGETATQRTVIFDVTTCPTDGITGVKVGQSRKFKILVSGQDPLTGEHFERTPLSEIRNDGGDSIVEVQNTNCMSWVDEMAHKYYQRENLVDRSYHIIDPLNGNEIFTLTGYFNPWDEKYGTLGVDARNLSESFIQEVRSRKKLPSRFFVGDFSYMTLRFRYDIDKNMNLTVKKTVLMSLYPYVKRYSNIINGINGNFPIRDGIYLLKVAYQKDYIDPGADGISLQRDENLSKTRVFVEDGNKDFNMGVDRFTLDDLRRKTMIHTSKKLIRVENNRVITPIEFHINELRTLRVRSNLLLQLEPVNQYKLQIVNLFERHIAKKLHLSIGNLGKYNCVQPGFKMAFLELFQETIDKIALAIPDDINYSSKESFEKVINSPEIVEALSYMTSDSLLEGISVTLDLASSKEEVDRAFKSINGGELADLNTGDELKEALEKLEQKSLMQRRSENKTLSLYDNIANSVAKLLPPFETDRTLENPFIVPMNDPSAQSLKPDVKSPPSPMGSSDDEIIDNAGVFAESTGLSIDQPTQNFLDEITKGSELEKLLVNDFTIDPAIARVSDLDYLIDRKAGIVRRTFVGPLTLLALDNKNVMNATDAVDYDASSNDGAQDQAIIPSYGDDFNSDYARNPNFGYQGHFKNCHVDDFIIPKDEELLKLLKDAWTECVTTSNQTIVSEDENSDDFSKIKIPDDFTCNYEDMNAYKNYLSRQSWGGHERSPFRRYRRLSDEQKLESGGQCHFREIWLKKYFSQKTAELAKEQFGNFLAHPSISAKFIVPHEDDLDETPHTLEIDAIDESCIENNYIGDRCFNKTKRFNQSVKTMAQNLLNPKYNKYFWNPNSDFSQSPYKKTFEEFYSKYDKNSLYRGSISEFELSKDIYKVLTNMAAPPLSQNTTDKYEGKLKQLRAMDFGVDSQKFMCNIMIPQAIKIFEDWLNEGQNSNKNRFSKWLMKKKFEYAIDDCRKYAETTEQIEVPLPFNIERKFRTLETGRYFFRGGKSLNFTVAQQVSLSHSLNVANKYTLDPINSVKNIVLGVASGFFAPFAAFTGGGIKVHDYSQAETNGVNDGKNLGTSAHLSMQAAELDLELKKYRRCMLVRWNKKYLRTVLPNLGTAATQEEIAEYMRTQRQDLELSYDPNLVIEQEKRARLVEENQYELSEVIPALSNIFVCGHEQNRREDSIAIREKYYYVTQHFTEGDLLDSGSLLNNPWLLTLRGYRDMVAFVQSMYPNKESLPQNVLDLIMDDYDRVTTKRPLFIPVQLRPANRNTFDTELEAWQIMSKAYKNVSPTFSGLYTQLSYSEASLPDWPWDQESQLSEQNDRTCDAALE